jgi:hypothetical protein
MMDRGAIGNTAYALEALGFSLYGNMVFLREGYSLYPSQSPVKNIFEGNNDRSTGLVPR